MRPRHGSLEDDGPESEGAMIRELDRIVLTAPVPEEGLEAGDVGTVVAVYADGKAYEIEFTTLEGKTAAVATVEATNIRPVRHREITHARDSPPTDARRQVAITYFYLYVILDIFNRYSSAGCSPRTRARRSRSASSPRPARSTVEREPRPSSWRHIDTVTYVCQCGLEGEHR